MKKKKKAVVQEVWGYLGQNHRALCFGAFSMASNYLTLNWGQGISNLYGALVIF